MAGTDVDTKIAALTAIVQTLVLEHYWEEDEEEAKRRFLALAEADHPLAMAIVHELTDEELDAAFRWPRSANADARNPLPATPVVAVLTEEQYEQARVTAVAEDECDRVRALAAEDADMPGGESLPANERMRIAQERFVAAMIQDLADRRGGEADAALKGTVEQRIADMPEPWKSRTMREVERLRNDLGEMHAEPGVDGR